MENHSQICPNCNNTLTNESKYCSTCSQKVRSGKVTIKEFLQEFVDNVFNLDSKLFQTLGALFIPGKLTLKYFEGKRKSYAPPIRIFLILLVAFLSTVSFYENNESRLGSGVVPFGKMKNKEKEMLGWIEKTKSQINDAYAVGDSNIAILDTFSVWYRYNMHWGEQTNSIFFVNFKEKRLNKFEVKAEDIVNLSDEELLEKHNIEGFVNTLLVKKMIKFTKNPLALNRFYLGSLTWLAFLLLPFMALAFKLFYRKQNHYFIEHLVFLFHVHSFWFLIGTLLVVFGKWLPSFLIIILGCSMFLYFLLALKSYYQQKWGTTIGKSFLIVISYIFSFAVFLIFFLFLSLLLF